VQDAVTSHSSPHRTGSHQRAAANFDTSADNSGAFVRIGQAAMLLSGAALLAVAARKGRSWKSAGAVALAGAPLLYRGATGRWPVPRAVSQAASDAVATAPIETALTIDKPRAELYAYWHRLENLPRFMKNLDTVTDLGGGRSHWVGKSPLGFKVEWDAEIVEEQEGRRLAWRSLPGAQVHSRVHTQAHSQVHSQVHNAGTVSFEDSPNGRGTIVRVRMEIGGSALGQAVGKLLKGSTRQEVHEDLRRFKELMETGEVATTDGQPHGIRSLIGHLHNPI
jgi:uncharacterized membrane protein